MPTVLEENRGRGFHVVSEANGHRSRETVQLNDGDLAVGTILGEITASPGEYLQVDPAAGDGTEVAAAVLFDAVDASDAAQPAVVHIRDCELMKDELVYPDGATAMEIAAIDAQLEALGIIVRT